MENQCLKRMSTVCSSSSCGGVQVLTVVMVAGPVAAVWVVWTWHTTQPSHTYTWTALMMNQHTCTGETIYFHFHFHCCCSFCSTSSTLCLCDGMYVCISVCLSVCLSVCMSVCPSVCLSVCLSVCMHDCKHDCVSLCLSVCLSVCLSACLAVCLYVWLCMYDCVSVCLTVCLSVCLSGGSQNLEIASFMSVRNFTVKWGTFYAREKLKVSMKEPNILIYFFFSVHHSIVFCFRCSV